MPSPFPGMNPCLEDPSLWSEVHSWLIVELARFLNPRITPKYRAAVEKRVYEQAVLVGISDVSIADKIPQPGRDQQRYLEIREVTTEEVVTVIEVLSPTNKRMGEGRDKYLSKRTKVLASQSHLVEIDLLRGGTPLPTNPKQTSGYRVLVSRVEQRPIAQLYPFNLRDPLPCFLMPLRPGDKEPAIDLNAIMQAVYESAALDLAIAYGQQPTPSLSADDWQWVQEHMS